MCLSFYVIEACTVNSENIFTKELMNKQLHKTTSRKRSRNIGGWVNFESESLRIEVDVEFEINTRTRHLFKLTQ